MSSRLLWRRIIATPSRDTIPLNFPRSKNIAAEVEQPRESGSQPENRGVHAHLVIIDFPAFNKTFFLFQSRTQSTFDFVSRAYPDISYLLTFQEKKEREREK